MIEIANNFVLIMTNDTISIISNFVSLVIIAEFDNYVFASMKGESFRKLIEKDFTEKVFIVAHTSSKKCGEEELSEIKDDEGEFRPLKVTWTSRSCGNKC
jgi:hypothetical protein